jgi:hypothetical protein
LLETSDTTLCGEHWDGKELCQQATEKFLCQESLNKIRRAGYEDEASGVSTKPFVRYVYTILIGKMPSNMYLGNLTAEA